MVDTLYVEKQVREHPRVLSIQRRFSNARVIYIERYSEVFNSHGQNFRLQKHNPSLILASKRPTRVLPAPAQYETGGGANYYFSHMLNCLYDCRYCFLQGMFQSAHYLMFVNYEDFLADIREVAEQHLDDAKPPWFFSGYDCDSLAYDPVSQFADFALDGFAALPHAVLELRTKSTQIRALLARPAAPNVVVAFSLSPPEVATQLEQGAPSFAKRVDALVKLQEHGWRLGLRFDPVIWHEDYFQHYADAFALVFERLDPERLDSFTLGGFRLPRDFHKRMKRLYPEHWLLRAGLDQNRALVTYQKEVEEEVLTSLAVQARKYVAADKLYVYPSADSDQAA